jgi:hypothetical protein
MATTKQTANAPPLRRAPWWQRLLRLAPSTALLSHNAQAIYMDFALGYFPPQRFHE